MSCEVVLPQCPSTREGENHCRSWPRGLGNVTALPGGRGHATCLDSQFLGGGGEEGHTSTCQTSKPPSDVWYVMSLPAKFLGVRTWLALTLTVLCPCRASISGNKVFFSRAITTESLSMSGHTHLHRWLQDHLREDGSQGNRGSIVHLRNDGRT